MRTRRFLDLPKLCINNSALPFLSDNRRSKDLEIRHGSNGDICARRHSSLERRSRVCTAFGRSIPRCGQRIPLGRGAKTRTNRFSVKKETNEDRSDVLVDPEAEIIQASDTDVEDGAAEAT